MGVGIGCGLDSLCNSEIYEEGAEFSSGEKQLLAITRARFRDGELFILDEPSSPLDPITGREILANFSKITNGKASILITHDMDLAKKCDRVIKIEDGFAKEIDLDMYSTLSSLGNN